MFSCFSFVARGYSWIPRNRRPEKLRDSLRELEVPAFPVHLPGTPSLPPPSSSSLWGFWEFSLSETADWLTNRGILSPFSLSFCLPCHFSFVLFSPSALSSPLFRPSSVIEGDIWGDQGLQAAPHPSSLLLFLLFASELVEVQTELCFARTCLFHEHARTYTTQATRAPPSCHP